MWCPAVVFYSDCTVRTPGEADDPTVGSGKRVSSNFNANIDASYASGRFPPNRGFLDTTCRTIQSRQSIMITVKDTLRATVRVSFDGQVTKQFHGPRARERFENEVRVLRHLEKRECPFVPRLISTDSEKLTMVTTNCGSRVVHLDNKRCEEIFDQLAEFNVRHDDPDIRNVTYRQRDGRFCLIDFEFASILDEPKKATSKRPQGKIRKKPFRKIHGG